MDSRITHYLFIALVLFFFASCGSDTAPTSTVETPAAPTTATPTPAQNNQVSLANLTKSSRNTLYAIDAINSTIVTKDNQPIAVQGAFFTVAGWAVDELNKTVASQVYVTVGSADFPAAYGGVRPDVATVHKNQDYTKSAYTAKIPISELTKGKHTVGLKVVDAKGEQYYEGNAKVDIMVN